MRNPSLLDRCLNQLDLALKTCYAEPSDPKPNPAEGLESAPMTDPERRQVGALMRINHVGEVCAQALYQGQALCSRDPEIRAQLLEASREEYDHLAWCHQRLGELEDRPSLLNPMWYGGAWLLGVTAATVGDDWSMGFVHETERQVEAHLLDHLDQLPESDLRSRAIVTQMAEDEARHGAEAMAHGGRPLPESIQMAMAAMARLMKAVAYRL